jgi:hypothetical protein
MTEIDWKAELRKYEREFDGLPPEPTAAELRDRRLAEDRAERRREEINGAAGAWLRLCLVIALAGAIRFWPYPRVCGMGLDVFLAAEGAVVLGGVWVAISAWRRRAAWAHALAIVVLLWGAGLISAELLPRVGYAKPDPARPASWACPATRP